MKKMTKEWIEKAESDHVMVNLIFDGGHRLHNANCFHCQQSAEKYLKAILEELGETVPRTHDLQLLLDRLEPFYPELRAFARCANTLSRYATNARYPGHRATKRTAMSAMKWEAKIREACRTILKVKEKPVRKK